MPTRPDAGELRVCLVVDGFYEMGGTERQIVELAAELHARAVPVTVLSRWPLEAGNAYVEELDEAGVAIVTPGWRGRPGGRLRRLAYIWARARAGSAGAEAVERELWRWQLRRLEGMAGPGFVVHVVPFLGAVSPAGRQALRRLRAPLVLTVLGQMKGVVPVVDPRAAIVTADGDPVVDPPSVAVAWVPSMGSRMVARFRPDPGRPRSGVVAYGGRLVPGKGVDVLIRAMAALPPDLRLVIAGYGPERDRLEALARTLGVDVRFLGPLDAAAFLRLLERTDVAVLPALEGEGLPSFVVEALGAGVPVVGTDVGTVARAVGGAGGVLVPPGDSDRLADAVRVIVEGNLEERRLAARRVFEDQFAPPRVVDRYLELYREALRRSTDADRSGGKSRAVELAAGAARPERVGP